jgi:hypothetical protein
VPINWSGKSAVARFATTYDKFTNTFVMKFDGLFGSCYPARSRLSRVPPRTSISYSIPSIGGRV